MVVHLIDGTYELFRHFYGLRRFRSSDPPLGAVAGVLGTVLQMLEDGATHLGVATDHVIESFRNELWPGYKTGAGVDPALRAQFEPLEEALAAMGVAVWPMVELEADDALASAARLAAGDDRVQRVTIWTPDKDLAQCVAGERVVQVDRRAKAIRDEDGVRAKFGVPPHRIPDYLALVGDAADGYPGIPGIGAKTAVRLIARHSAPTPSGHSCSRTWPPCGPTPPCSPMPTSCAGRARRPPSIGSRRAWTPPGWPSGRRSWPRARLGVGPFRGVPFAGEGRPVQGGLVPVGGRAP
jgi:5'-3' exonuclease